MTVPIPIDDDRSGRTSHHFERRHAVVGGIAEKVDTSATVKQSFPATSKKMEGQRVASIRASDHVRDSVSIEIPELGIKRPLASANRDSS